MAIITIPKKFNRKNDDLILIPRKEYEALLSPKSKQPKEIPFTQAQRQSLVKARKNLVAGNSLTIHELKTKLGIKD